MKRWPIRRPPSAVIAASLSRSRPIWHAGELTQGGEWLLGDIITENTMATATSPINVRLPRYDPLAKNVLIHRRELTRARSKALSVAQTLVRVHRGPKSSKTDIINASQLAGAVFGGPKGRAARRKVLIVFSDMIEQSKRYDFASLSLTPGRIASVIEAERKARPSTLPDLHGVDTWVCGATASASGGLSDRRILSIREFWHRYFEACGARLPSEQYGTTLINFEMPSQP
ncbi:MAG: hypothetical protein FJX72_08355 [Armatimonadetes bacterium]|nr:hypothetical protein [Armatimonadota bacterium]